MKVAQSAHRSTRRSWQRHGKQPRGCASPSTCRYPQRTPSQQAVSLGGFFPVAAEYIWGEKKSYLNMLGHMRDAIDYFTPQRSVASIDGASIIQWVTQNAGR